MYVISSRQTHLWMKYHKILIHIRTSNRLGGFYNLIGKFTINLFIYFIYVINAINTLRPGQDGRNYPDDIFKCIFLNESVWISIKISLKFVPKGPINNILSLVQIIAWRRSGDKLLSEPMMFSLRTHICATRPQWVKDTNRIHHPTYIWRIICVHVYICLYVYTPYKQ